RLADRARGAFREDARFGRALSSAIADGVDVREARLKSLGLHRHLDVMRQTAIFEYFRSTDCRDAKEKIVGKYAAIIEVHNPALRFHRFQFTVPDECDVPLRERL